MAHARYVSEPKIASFLVVSTMERSHHMYLSTGSVPQKVPYNIHMYIIVIRFTSRDFYFFLIKVPLHLIPYNDSIYFLLLSKDIFYCNTKKMACIHHFGRGPNQTEKWCVPHHNWPLSLYPLFFDSKSKSNERETGRGVMPKTS